jgi:hypothetical protein
VISSNPSELHESSLFNSILALRVYSPAWFKLLICLKCFSISAVILRWRSSSSSYSVSCCFICLSVLRFSSTSLSISVAYLNSPNLTNSFKSSGSSWLWKVCA